MSIRRSLVVRSLVLFVVACPLTGCSTYEYEYVLQVRCEGRPIPNKPPWIRHVGLTPPVDVTIECDGKTEHLSFDPMGETKTIRFGERSRVMIDGGAILRGFTVRIHRPGYKDWTAEYGDDGHLMRRRDDGQDGAFIRLDTVLLQPADNPNPSIRLTGGPEPTNDVPRPARPPKGEAKDGPSSP